MEGDSSLSIKGEKDAAGSFRFRSIACRQGDGHGGRARSTSEYRAASTLQPQPPPHTRTRNKRKQRRGEERRGEEGRKEYGARERMSRVESRSERGGERNRKKAASGKGSKSRMWPSDGAVDVRGRPNSPVQLAHASTTLIPAAVSLAITASTSASASAAFTSASASVSFSVLHPCSPHLSASIALSGPLLSLTPSNACLGPRLLTLQLLMSVSALFVFALIAS